MGLDDAIKKGIDHLEGIPLAIGVMDFHFIRGSMRSIVGEKIIDESIKNDYKYS